MSRRLTTLGWIALIWLSMSTMLLVLGIIGLASLGWDRWGAGLTREGIFTGIAYVGGMMSMIGWLPTLILWPIDSDGSYMDWATEEVDNG